MANSTNVLAFANSTHGDIPAQVGGYKLLERLGRGPHAEAFRAVGEKGEVRLKLYHPISSPAGHLVLIKALRKRAEPRSDSLLQVDVVADATLNGQERIYTVSPLLDGVSLQDLLRRDQSLPVSRALEVAERIFAAAELMHEHGLVHGALHPRNIFLVSDPVLGERVVFTDGGVTAATYRTYILSELEAGRTFPPGTVFSAPELADGRSPAEQADTYALGMVLRQLMGQEYHGIEPIVQKCLAPLEKDRPADGAALRRMLWDVQSEVTRTGALAPLTVNGAGGRRKGGAPWWLAVAALAVVVLGLLLWGLQPAATDGDAPAALVDQEQEAPPAASAGAPEGEASPTPAGQEAAEAVEEVQPEAAETADVGEAAPVVKERRPAARRRAVSPPKPAPEEAPAAAETTPEPEPAPAKAEPATQASEPGINAVKDVRDPWAD